MTSNKQAKRAARATAAAQGISYTAARRQDPLTIVTSTGPLGITPAINWDHISQHHFDRVVEALLDRLYDQPGAMVQAIDGRGGDGGRDVLVQRDGRLHIFQLKCFSDGFSSERASRRKQIKKSFAAAMRHQPYEWVLVIPANPAPGEIAFVNGLAASHPGLKVRIMGRKELDSSLALFPDLVAFFARDNMRELAVLYKQEQAALHGGLPDLTDRMRKLARVGDILDPHWGVDIAVVDGTVVHSLRGKHKYAGERSPITLNLTGTFGPEDAQLAAAARRSFGFGTFEQITLPPGTVERLSITGPDWLPEPQGRVEVTWKPVRRLPETPSTARLSLFAADGTVMSAHQGQVRHAGAGYLGFALEMEFSPQITLTLLFGSGDGAELNGHLDLTNAMPAAVLQAIALCRDLHDSTAIEVQLDEVVIGQLECPPGFDARLNRKALAVTELLADDLAVVQRHCRTYFPVPHDLSVHDRISIRAARLLIEGHCVIYPGARTFTATLTGDLDGQLRNLLTSAKPECVRIGADLTIEVASQQLALGHVNMFHTQVEIPDGRKLLRALTAGRGAGLQMRLTPTGGQYYKAFLPDARAGRDDEPLTVTGWGLPGLDGPPGEMIDEISGQAGSGQA